MSRENKIGLKACFIIVLIQGIVIHADIMIIDPPSPDCRPFRELLELTLVEYAATYFADNPRGTNEPIVPQAIDPLTARNLFETYYGADATTQNFEEVKTKILYSDPGNQGSEILSNKASLLEADRIVLRDNIFAYAKAGSMDLAREKFGALIFRAGNELGGANWEKYRCMKFGSASDQMQGAIHTELSRLRNEIGEFNFGTFLGLGSGTTLAFAIDDTGSMSGEIQAAKQRAINIIDQRQGSLDQPQNFVLVPFNDPGVGPLTVTNDPDVFKKAINRLRAHGGGDAPELSMRGIQLAVENSNPGSTIFVITDVDAKDVELQDNVVAQAKQKNIEITFLLTTQVTKNTCHFTTSHPRCNNPSLRFGLDLYKYIAQSTGGRVLVVSKGDIFRATEVIESTLKQGIVEIYRNDFERGDHKAVFFVDSQLSGLFIFSLGDCDNVTITRPDGTTAEQKGKLIVDKLTESRVEINDTFGQYGLSMSTRGKCEIKISSRSPKGFVKTLAKRVIDSSSGETRYERFEGQSLITDDVVVLIDEYGKQSGDVTELIEVIDRSSGTSHPVPLNNSRVESYTVPVYDYPGRSLMVVVRGKDKLGFDFQRTSPTDIERVPLDIDCSILSDLVIRPGRRFNANLTINNIGREQTFSLEATDDKGFLSKKLPIRMTIGENSSSSFSIFGKPGGEERRGAMSTVTITASSESADGLIFKQCRLIVGQRQFPDIEAIEIVSNINSRFVETSVSSTVFNDAKEARAAEFHVIMPTSAFITEFSMTIDGVNYPGEIEEKEQAKKIFDLAKAKGLTAGHVVTRDKSVRVFRTSVNVEGEKRVLFNLKYQQILQRSKGNYRHEIIAQTRQPVKKLSIDVFICENRPLTPVNVLGFDTEQSIRPGPIQIPGATVEQQRTTAHVSFKPTREEQLKLSPLGLDGKFIIEYDVERRDGKVVNEMVADDRHFVHFFSPKLDVMNKRVVFLLDNSGSMFGRKMGQLRSAMNIILDGLNGEDYFSIVMFNSNASRWEGNVGSSMAPANEMNKKAAGQFLQDVATEGGTNIGLAVEEAIEVLEEFNEESEKIQHPTSDYILLLTDGRPTEGIVAKGKLVNFIDTRNNQTYGIHTIGFGTLVDMKTLARIAARNKGSSIQIFEDLDADLQISDFFETIAKPMLRDIEIIYDTEQIISTSVTNFTVLNSGSELVVSGEFNVGPKNEARRRKRETFMGRFVDVKIRGWIRPMKY